MRLRLPDRAHVEMTGPTDPICLHYRFPFNILLNKRLTSALRLLEGRRFRRCLEAGVGGGVLLPSLRQCCDRVIGVDIHDRLGAVRRLADAERVPAAVSRGSVTALPFSDASFDGVVCLSVLEFVAAYRDAIRELARVAEPGGTVILGFPVESWITDVGYRLARTPDPKKVHHAQSRELFAAADEALVREAVVTVPRGLPVHTALFAVGRWRKA